MSNEERASRDRIVQLVRDACTRLAEHVDTVQIMVTFHAEDGEHTDSYDEGVGNFYARQAKVDEWLRFQREYQRCEARRREGYYPSERGGGDGGASDGDILSDGPE